MARVTHLLRSNLSHEEAKARKNRGHPGMGPRVVHKGMARPVIQPHLARTTDGREVVTCCGPALLRVEGLKGYERFGPARAGICCHEGRWPGWE